MSPDVERAAPDWQVDAALIPIKTLIKKGTPIMAGQKQVVAVGRQINGVKSGRIDPAYRAQQQASIRKGGK